MTGTMNKSRRTGLAVAGILLVAAILVLVNVIFAGALVRLDLTEHKEFTVSAATREMLGDLRDLVTITVYVSEDLPLQLSTLRRQISDLLDEYRNYGRGQVQIDFVDPSADPEMEQRLRTLGIPQIMAQTVDRDQLQVVNIYLGMTVNYLDRQEVLPVVQDTYRLEYDLTSAILKVSRDEDYTIGILSGPTNYDTGQGLGTLREMLQRQFRVQTVNIGAGEEPVAEEIDLLIVAGPSQVPDRVEYQIDQYVMRGGRVIFLIDGISLPESGGLQALPVETGIEDLLAHYGVRVQQALVLDRALCAPASFSGGFVRYTIPYPYWPKAVPELLNSEHPVTAKLESMVWPWVAPLELDVPIGAGDPIGRIEEIAEQQREAQREMARQLGMQVPEEDASAANGEEGAPRTEAELDAAPVVASVLARTSPSAWTVSGRYDLNPQQNFPPGVPHSSILAVALRGRFPSYYADREAPSLENAVAPGEAAAGEAPETGVDDALVPAPTDEAIQESTPTRLLVVGNAHFATDMFINQFPENSVFLLNAIDWMTLGEQLISIRSRGATERPLRELSDGARNTIKLLCILGAPILAILFGFLRQTMRRRTWSAQEVAAREA